MTSRRVGSGSTGIESAKVRLVFSRRSSSETVFMTPASARETRRDSRTQSCMRRRIRRRVPHERGLEERPAGDFAPADAAVGADGVGEESRKLLVGGVADGAHDEVGDPAGRGLPRPRRRLHVGDHGLFADDRRRRARPWRPRETIGRSTVTSVPGRAPAGDGPLEQARIGRRPRRRPRSGRGGTPTRSPTARPGESAPARPRSDEGRGPVPLQERSPRPRRRASARRPCSRARHLRADSGTARRMPASSSGIAARIATGPASATDVTRACETTRRRARAAPRRGSAAGPAHARRASRRSTSGASTSARSRARSAAALPGDARPARVRTPRRRAGSSGAGGRSGPEASVEPRERVEDLLQAHVAVAQDVALARPSLLGGREMARRDVAHVDQVQPGVDVGRHPAIEKVDDHLAGRRGLDVALADRSRRVHDHDRQAPSRPSRAATRSASYLDFL